MLQALCHNDKFFSQNDPSGTKTKETSYEVLSLTGWRKPFSLKVALIIHFLLKANLFFKIIFLRYTMSGS